MAQLFKCLQANVQHSKAGSYLLGKRILDERIYIALIQESWVTSRGRINGLSNLPGKVISLGYGESPRSCIFVRNTIDISVLTGFCSRDVTSNLVKLPLEMGTKELVICSAYFPGDTMFPPPNEVRKLVAFCRGKNLQLLVACDANSHHTTWDSTDINERGEYLFDFILEEALFVLNRASVPTFVTKNWAEVLDTTLCLQYLSTKITDSRVSDTPSGSDHKNIQFNIELGGKPIQEYRNPRLTDWDGYKLSLQRNLRSINVNVNNHEDLERLANSIGQAIVSAYHENCR
ncbi:uncharacterized protein LOC123318151 [Coccinella septempunctata]|uniref:uncharacterized protein LOC123318151 n=1 Tax=Coccinella septempunctata TaxID=41139 RepID=UPI001D06B036|nr:uncharacterized protein LOC123318151 [Coccinella septempunctata]